MCVLEGGGGAYSATDGLGDHYCGGGGGGGHLRYDRSFNVN